MKLLKKINPGFMRMVLWLSQQRFLFLLSGFILINCFCQLVILYFLPTDVEHPTLSDPLWRQLLRTIIAAPIIETLIFQVLVIGITLKKISNTEIVAVAFSGLLFGLWHSTNLTFIVAAFIAGLALGILYFVFKQQKRSPFIYLTLIHAGFNLFALIIDELVLSDSI